jgi:hypothetical protein
LRQQFNGGQTAQAPLTWSHSASCKRLHLVRARRPERRDFSQLAGFDFFAAADDGAVVLWHTKPFAGPEPMLYKSPAPKGARELPRELVSALFVGTAANAI